MKTQFTINLDKVFGVITMAIGCALIVLGVHALVTVIRAIRAIHGH